MDYLAEENIIKTRRVAAGDLHPRDVKNAVLCLMLNPNDTWARLLLILYTRPDLAESSDGKALAIQSRLATRIARGIHKYDRERSPLLKFLLKSATLAELDVYDYLNRIAGADEGTAAGIGERAGVAGTLDYNEPGGFGFFGVKSIRTESYLARLIYEKPFGETIRFPLFEKDKDGRITPLLAPTLKMSEDELKSALIILLQNEQRTRDLISLYRPQTPTPDPALLMPRFKEYYESCCRGKIGKIRQKWERERALYELVFEKMILDTCNLEDVEAEYLSRYGEEPPARAKQARYSERGKRILAGFEDWRGSNSENRAE
jgi:hypothetical protein